MLYIWIDENDGRGFEPHMTFDKSDREDALHEISTIKEQGHKAKFGSIFDYDALENIT